MDTRSVYKSSRASAARQKQAHEARCEQPARYVLKLHAGAGIHLRGVATVDLHMYTEAIRTDRKKCAGEVFVFYCFL